MTSFHVQNVQRMRAYIEPNGSLATDHTGTLGDFWDIPFIEGSAEITLERPTIDPMTNRQDRDNHNEELLGVKRGKVKFQMNLAVADSRAGDGVAMATTAPIGRLMGLVLGGSNYGTGDTVNTSAATTTAITVANASRWQAGGCMGWGDANGVMHLREIAEMSGSVALLKLALPSSPANSDPLYNCASFYPDNHDSDDVTTLQLIVEGLGNAGDGYHESWVLLGGQIEEPFTFEFPKGELPKVTFSFTFADWDHGDEATMTPAAIGAASFANTNEVLFADSEFRIQVNGTTTLSGSEVHASEIAIEPQFKYVEVPSPGGTNNIAAFVMDGSHPKVQGSFKAPYQDQTWFNARNSKTDEAIFLQIGSSESNGAILISAPTAQITDWQREDANGLMGQMVSWKGRLDGDTTESTATVMGYAPFRIHFA